MVSPLLFFINAEAVMREVFDGMDDGVKIGRGSMKAVRFADHQAIITNTEKGLQNIMDEKKQVVEKFGTKINIKKTKVMKIGRSYSNKKIAAAVGIYVIGKSVFNE